MQNLRRAGLSKIEMNARTQMALTLVNSFVIILLVYVHIDTGGGREGGGGGGGAGQGWRAEGGQGSRVEVMRVLRKLQAAQVYHLRSRLTHYPVTTF